ncbi:hypothetical protein ACS0TY_035819 [Phlomoides rotata]
MPRRQVEFVKKGVLFLERGLAVEELLKEHYMGRRVVEKAPDSAEALGAKGGNLGGLEVAVDNEMQKLGNLALFLG